VISALSKPKATCQKLVRETLHYEKSDVYNFHCFGCRHGGYGGTLIFSEVSLWVRARETDQSIVRKVSQRKLARALTPQQEATLKSQGASDSLVQSLRSPNVIAAPADVAASEIKSQPPRMPKPQKTEADSAADNLHIFECLPATQ
jgi:hypothetical protein